MSLVERLAALDDAVAAGSDLGLDAVPTAEAVLERSRSRIGYPGGAYVLALAGGTGVGKSSVLNAIAGQAVSRADAIRPTTDRPVAWVGEERRAELAPLLEWLEVERVVTHRDGGLNHLAVLDLPDIDSIRTEHRAQVDGVLPRIDALAWVVDPEKYDDERLYEYLRALTHQAPRLRIILNKADRLAATDRDTIAADLRRRLSDAGLAPLSIHVVSASTGAGVADLRAELQDASDAKAVIDGKLAADALAAIEALAGEAGVTAGGHAPLLDSAARSRAVREAQTGALALVDVDGLRDQARRSVLARARRSGGGLLGRVAAWLGRLSGRETRRADPAAYLRGWRRRGTLARAVNPLHAAIADAVRGAPPRSRAALLRRAASDEIEPGLAAAIDSAVDVLAPSAVPPSSWLWPVVGVLQLAAAAVFLFAVAWYATLVFAGGLPVATVEVPWIGPLPLPLVLLAGGLLASIVLGWLLTLHAGWVGRRFARRVARAVAERVAASVESHAFVGLDDIESAREHMARALERARRDPAPA